jgi:DNA-binding transcriptional ArsR family regulator
MYQKEEYRRNTGKILIALIEGEKDFSSLRDHTNLSPPTLSSHLKDLLERKLVSFRRDGKRKVYYPLERAYNDPEVKRHLIGVFEAYRIFKVKRKFWNEVGKKAVQLFNISPEAAFSFLAAISKYRPVFGEERYGDILESIYLRMTDDFNQLVEMKNTVQEFEARGMDVKSLRMKFESKMRDLKNMYIALGPPFSYKWLKMMERIDI